MMIFQQPALVSNHPTISSKVWKDLDDVLTCHPNIYLGAEPVPYLTYDEAVELAYFGAQVVMVDARSQQVASMAKFHLIGHTFPISYAKTQVVILKGNILAT